MSRSTSYTYDPSTGEWKTTTNDSNSGNDNDDSSKKSGSDNLTSTDTDKGSSKGDTEKKYNTIEYNTLSGTLNFISTNKTIKLKAGDTVTINGIGKYLSGDYYVQDITRSISSSGYSHSATLIKTDMGATLKTSTTKTEKTTPPKPTSTVSSNAPKEEQTATRKYTVVTGDCLWKIARQFYGNGVQYPKIADANGIRPPYIIYTGQVLTIP